MVIDMDLLSSGVREPRRVPYHQVEPTTPSRLGVLRDLIVGRDAEDAREGKMGVQESIARSELGDLLAQSWVCALGVCSEQAEYAVSENGCVPLLAYEGCRAPGVSD